MSLAGVHLVVHLGKNPPSPAPAWLMERLVSVSVQQPHDGVSTFDLTFQAGRSAKDKDDDPTVVHEKLEPFTRVVIELVLRGTPYVLMDGVITQQQFSPGAEAGASTFTVTGEDLSFYMRRLAIGFTWPKLPRSAQVLATLARYAVYGVVPLVIPHPTDLGATPVQRLEVRPQTDLEYVQEAAAELGYVFRVVPGPSVGRSTAYFGPQLDGLASQKALTFAGGASTNVGSIQFRHAAHEAFTVAGVVMPEGRFSYAPPVPVVVPGMSRLPLTKHPTLLQTPLDALAVRGLPKLTGSVPQAYLQALVAVNQSGQTVTASGEVDGLRYDAVLEPRRTVDVRGVGESYDGSWYVNSVGHSIRKGEYKQSFELSREGLGSRKSVVRT
jgi:hypothetical protein